MEMNREKGIIFDLYKFANKADMDKNLEWLEYIMKEFNLPEELREKKRAAVREMNEILHNKDNSAGYHLNHITNNKPIWDVYKRDGKAYAYQAEYPTREEAEANAVGDTEIEERKQEDGTKVYEVWVLDEAQTEALKKQDIGSYVATFDTKEEAEAEAEGLTDAFVQERLDKELWVVVNNETKEAFELFFTDIIDALESLYRKARPKCWMEYRSVYDELYPAKESEE